MLDITETSLEQRRQCIADFGSDTLDRMILRLRCPECDFLGESSALVATTGFGFESVIRLQEVVERIVAEPRLADTCPSCAEGDVRLEKLYYLAWSEELGADFAAEFVPSPADPERWLIAGFLSKPEAGQRPERISVADSRLREVFRETLLRAAASASEVGKDPELAKQIIERSVELFGESLRDRYLLVAVLREAGEIDEALETLGEIDGGPEVRRRQRFEIGVTHFAALREGKDHLVQAFSAFQEILDEDAEHAPSHLYIGNLYLGLGCFEESLDHFRQAVESEPEMMEAHFNAGIALARLDKPKRALDYFQRAYEMAPDDVEVLEYLGETLEALGDGQEAKELRARAREIAAAEEAFKQLGDAGEPGEDAFDGDSGGLEWRELGPDDPEPDSDA